MRWTLILLWGTLTLAPSLVDELDLELAMGNVSADSLTVKDADFDLAMGGCHIDHLSAPEFDAELAMGDCTIGMLSGAQDVSISVTTWRGRLDPGGQRLGLLPSSPMGLRAPRARMARPIASRKISLSTTTGDLSISYTN